VTTSWTSVLDECDARLEAATAALDRGTLDHGAGEPVTPFAGADVSEPLPSDLVERARALVDRSEVLEQRLRDEQDRLRSELRRLPRMPAAPREVHFEVKA
jgi:hypothetical protein